MEKMCPALVREAILVHAEQWPPAWSKGLDLWIHIRLVGQLVSFARVAAETRGDNIVPSRAATFVAGSHVVEIELGLRKDFGAILAGEFIPQEYIPPGKLHFEARQTVVNQKDHDFRNPEGNPRCVDHFRIVTSAGVANP